MILPHLDLCPRLVSQSIFSDLGHSVQTLESTFCLNGERHIV